MSDQTKILIITAALLGLAAWYSQASAQAVEPVLAPVFVESLAADPCGLEVVACSNEEDPKDDKTRGVAGDETIQAMITRMAIAEGVNPSTALRIANCESTFRPAVKNAHSSATGLYQFTIGTWRWIGAEAAGMDRTNPEHSTQMFLKYYPKHPSWWECR